VSSPAELERVTYAGHGGDPVAALHVPGPGAASEPGPGLLLIHEVTGLDGHLAELAARCATLGCAVLAPDLWSREGTPGAFESLPDRRALADLEAGLAWLSGREAVDTGRLAACGLGLGGTLAFQLACTSRRLAAAVDFCGRLTHARLSANHPVQPLELALNLACPVLFHFAAEDPAVPPGEVARLEATLGPFMKDYAVERWAGAGHGFLNRRRPGYHEPSAHAAWERTAQFLREQLDVRETP